MHRPSGGATLGGQFIQAIPESLKLRLLASGTTATRQRHDFRAANPVRQKTQRCLLARGTAAARRRQITKNSQLGKMQDIQLQRIIEEDIIAAGI